MKFNATLHKIIAADLATDRIVPFLAGEPGIGKTSFIKSLAKHYDTEVFTMQANMMQEKGDVTGIRTVPTPDGSGWTQISVPREEVLEANAYAVANPDKIVFLNIEEINRTDADVTSALMTIPTERRCGRVDLEPNIRVVISGNTKGNVSVLDSASLSRFAIYEVEADAGVFMELMGDDLHPIIRESLTENPGYIFIKPANATETYSAQVSRAEAADPDAHRDEDDSAAFNLDIFSENEMIQFTTPRTVEGLNNWLNNVDDAFLRELMTEETDGNRTMLTATLEAHTGDTAFTADIAMRVINHLSAPKSAAAAPTGPTPIAVPTSYNGLVAATTLTDLDRAMDSMSAIELQDTFLYTMTQPTSARNAPILAGVSGRLSHLDSEARRTLLEHIMAGNVSTDNVQALQDNNDAIFTTLRPFFDIMP